MINQQRWTRGQRTVLDVLQDSKDQLLSAQQIYTQLRDTPHEVGLATVYRALEMLVARGTIQAISLGDQQTYYQMQDNSRHGGHHLICLSCKKVIPLSACPVSELERQLSRRHDFAISYHILNFFGLCTNCSATNSLSKI